MTSSQPDTGNRAPASRIRRALPVLARCAVAAGAGMVLYLSFPPRTLWWLAPIAVAALCAVIWRRTARAGFGYGLLFALAWQLPLLKWLDDFLSPQFGLAPWLALSTVCALLIAVPVAAMAVVSSLPGAPVWMAMLLVAGESLRSNFPLNGFPWNKLAYSQADGVFLPLASVGGAPLVGLAVALCGAALACGGRALLAGAAGRTGGLLLSGCLLVIPIVAAAALTPTITDQPDGRTLRVAVVQGNAPNVGIDLRSEQDTIWANHRRQLERLTQQIHSGNRERPDVVVLPETATALDRTGEIRAQLREYTDDLRVPLVVGARTYPPDGTVRNSVLAFEPGRGQTAQYSKQELVPFSEYIPLRAIASWFTPFLDGAGDMTPGDRPAVMDVGGNRLGFAICYEIAYDWVARQAVDSGAQLLVVPTNNAWFGRTEMTYQQLAMSRIRAVEHDRAVVNAATSGVSAIVRPDGTVTRHTGLFTPATLVGEVPLRSQATLSDRLGVMPELALLVGGLLALLLAIGTRLRDRRARARQDEASQYETSQDKAPIKRNRRVRGTRRRGGHE